MTPQIFLERLLVHFGKRHPSEAAERSWKIDMLGIARGADPGVLSKAYDLIIREHDERSFPVPAVLRRYIERAAEHVHPESSAARGQGSSFVPRAPVARYVDPKFEAACRHAAAWQQQIIDRYGTWANYWRAVQHSHIDERGRGPGSRNT